ncbi:nephrin-like isoform X2 [Mya arenaria]|uniref:nephrin-like isoform X2 n=1 Tax=Mya arenaria TaxID=6604 RepID=UPI0022E69E5A|nr:nephrin-like isoform X2 [Mya arenaria]
MEWYFSAFWIYMQIYIESGWSCPASSPRLFGRENDPIKLTLTTSVNTHGLVNYQLWKDDKNFMTTAFYNGEVVQQEPCAPADCTFTGNAANGDFSITLSNVQKASAGTYKLIAVITNDAKACTTLYVLGSPNRPTVSSNKNPFVGESVIVTCRSSSTTTPLNHGLSLSYEWTIDDQTNPTSARYTYSTSRHQLAISNVQKTDSTIVLKCSAAEVVTNGYTSPESLGFTFNVLYGPDRPLLNIASPFTVWEGEEVQRFECTSDCWPGCNQKWMNAANVTIQHNGTLALGIGTRDKTGLYICVSENNGTEYKKQNETSLMLIVEYAPDVVISQSTTILTENNPLNLRCKATGVPAVYNYTGFVQLVGDVVISNSHAESPGVRDTISVNITSLQLQDTGIYTCNVHNGIIGVNKQLIQTASKRITVRASPKFFVKETNFAGEPSGNIIVTIPFVSVPEYTTYTVIRKGGKPVSTNGKYTLQNKKDFVNALFYGKQVTLTGNVLKMIITDLSEEEFGIYNIQITNSIDTSNFSIHVTAATKPSPPTELNLTSKDNTVTFEWKKGYNGGREQTFVLQASLYPEGSWVNITNIRETDSKYMKYTGRYQVNLTNLVQGIYSARLVALNGIGAAEPVVFKTTFEVMELNKEATPQTGVGRVIGGTVGGIVAALVLVIVIVFAIRRKYTCVCVVKQAKLEDLHEDTQRDHIMDTEPISSTTTCI